MASPARIRSTITSIASPPEELREVAIVHKALADPTRLRILERLARGLMNRPIGQPDQGLQDDSRRGPAGPERAREPL